MVSEGVEGVVAEDVTLNPAGSAPSTGSNDEDQLAAGCGSQESFYESGAQKAGASGDGDAPFR